MNDSHACEAEMKLYSTRKTSTTRNCTARRLCAYDTVCFTVNNCHSSFWLKCSGIIVRLDGYEHFPLVYLLAAPVKRIWMISWISHMYANCACMWFASVDVMKIVPGLLGLSVNMVALLFRAKRTGCQCWLVCDTRQTCVKWLISILCANLSSQNGQKSVQSLLFYVASLNEMPFSANICSDYTVFRLFECCRFGSTAFYLA